MVTFRWIKMFLFFILMLQFGGAHSGDLLLSFTVRDGDKVTLPCENVINNHHNCDTTTWLFIDSRGKAAVELVNHGQIKETAKSDRLSVTAECSLVIKKVTAEDVGRYTCRQFRGNQGRQNGQDAVVHLSVVHMTEQKNADAVTLNCSVSIYVRCKHKVKWIHNSEALDRDYSKLKTSQSPCSATVTFLNLAYTHLLTYDFNCSVTTEDNKEQLFTYSTQSSGEKSNTATTIKSETTTGNTTKELEIMDDSTKLPGSCWYRLIIVPLGLAALIAAVVVVNIWTRAGENIHI
ncbi:coagulation factor II (thrombin) receptor [Sarotherodon galilaeus]